MEHLTKETLARLVDERPHPEQRDHLASCTVCALELRALRQQTEALGSLPDLRPPPGDWVELEARLMSEGLVDGGGRSNGFSVLLRTGWMQAAAAVILFLGGTSFGAAMSGDVEGAIHDPANARIASVPESVQDAAEAVYNAEQAYQQALVQYGQIERGGRAQNYGELLGRAATLDALLAATQEAVRIAPSDPFFNGLLVNTLAEREQMLRQISSTRDGGWF
ncbi:MAG: hypothetical protein BMS9Abin29_1677 [Gemmatimonadota bacterium]|nr:MAG: hypothetical protein BMS9Abin29_1677 [Gemmatimonadota bacterium]